MRLKRSTLNAVVGIGVALAFVNLYFSTPSLIARANHLDKINGKLTTATYWWLSAHEIAAVTSGREYEMFPLPVDC